MRTTIFHIPEKILIEVDSDTNNVVLIMPTDVATSMVRDLFHDRRYMQGLVNLLTETQDAQSK